VAVPAADEREMRRARQFGWTSLALWAVAGLALETAHGLKLAPYLDDELTRLLLTLAHAAAREDGGRAIGRRLRGGAALVPIGFGLGAVAHPEGDPSIAIVLVPIGAVALLVALARLAWSAWRA
jgi:hypothetical protein